LADTNKDNPERKVRLSFLGQLPGETAQAESGRMRAPVSWKWKNM
jgi:hypothetical protein